MRIQIWSDDGDELLDDIRIDSKNISLKGYETNNEPTKKFLKKLFEMIDGVRKYDH